MDIKHPQGKRLGLNDWLFRSNGMKKFILDALTLSRFSNLPTVWTNVLVAWTINSTASHTLKIIPEISDFNFFDWSIFLYLLIGASLIYAGGCTLNDALDQKFDQKYNPQRPLPRGSISIQKVWILGVLEILLGTYCLNQLAQCEIIWVISLAASVVIYDIVHKKWSGGIVIMGCCRFFLWLSAATCMGNSQIAPQTWIWGAILMFYIIGISFFARSEAKKEIIHSKLSIILLFGSPLTALAGLVYWNNLDPVRVFLINIVGLLVTWIVFSSISIIQKQKKDCIGMGVSRMLAGICALDATAIAFYSPTLIAPTLCCLSFAVIVQKKFAAT